MTTNNDLKSSIFQCSGVEHTLTFVEQPSIGIFCNHPGLMIKQTRFGVITSVLMSSSKSIYSQIPHAKVQSIVQLFLDELQVLGQEQHAYSD